MTFRTPQKSATASGALPLMLTEHFLDGLAAGVIVFSEQLLITASNRAVERLCGWLPGDLRGNNLDFLFPAISGQPPFWTAPQTEDGRTQHHQVTIRCREGGTIYTTVSLSRLLDENGQGRGGVIAFNSDATAQRNQYILASIADGIFTVDRNWIITFFNPAAERITGWESSEAVGRPCSEIFRSSLCGQNCPVATSLYSGHPVASHVINITGRDGRTIPVSVSASPLVDGDGNIIGGVETFRDLSESHIVRRPPRKRSTFGDVISKNSAMRRIFEILPEIARSDSNVIILGESGTGKELVARATHAASNRRKGPFVTVNCGALPDTLLESELFGYKAGAFTDAKHDRPGRFAAAEKGTIFLDEIGDIPGSLQVKLLRVLQERVYEPLGSNTSIKADVRVIAATNRDLLTLVGQGLFRDDLYYRLNVVKLLLPPLRDRKEDIPMLCQHFITTFCSRQGKEISGISEAAMDILMRYDFPGNIRELENIIEYSFILCHGGLIMPHHLPEPLAPQGAASDRISTTTTPRSLDELEKQAIFAALERNGWRKIMTCRELGISKDTLRRKIQKYQLSGPDDPDFPEE